MRFPFIQFTPTTNKSVKISPSSLQAPNTTIEIVLPAGAAAGNQILKTNSTDPKKLEWIDVPSGGGGGGGLSSVGLGLPAQFSVSNSPLISNGSITVSWSSFGQNLVLASPVSASGVPDFRSLVAADIPALPAAKITTGTIDLTRLPIGNTASTIASGADNRFHNQNTDTGTSAIAFQLDVLSGGGKVKSESTTLIALRNAADTADIDLRVRNLTTTGSVTTINTTELAIADNSITLNSDYSGSTPTENAGIEVNRGSQAKALLRWDESDDFWKLGTDTNINRIARILSISFTNTDLVNGVLTVIHNLGTSAIGWRVRLSDGGSIEPYSPSASATNLVLDFGLNANFSGTVVIYG